MRAKERMELHIVLIEPRIPQNTGNIARTCAATGAFLHLVGPLGFQIDDKKLKRAGLDYWRKLNITYYENSEQFFSKHDKKLLYYFSTKAKKRYTDVSYPEKVFLTFGREDAGLDEKLLSENIDRCLRLPMGEGIRSLNLSNAVAVATYEVLRQWDFKGLCQEGKLTMKQRGGEKIE